MVVFAVDIGRRMMELRGTSLQCGRRTLLRQRCNPISGMARLTSRQGRLRRSDSERYLELRCGSCSRIEEFASLEHRVHDHRQFARGGHGGSFEADPLPEPNRKTLSGYPQTEWGLCTGDRIGRRSIRLCSLAGRCATRAPTGRLRDGMRVTAARGRAPEHAFSK